jgi:hypothetical protein
MAGGTRSGRAATAKRGHAARRDCKACLAKPSPVVGWQGGWKCGMDKQCWKWTSVHGQATSTVFYAPRSEPTPVAARLSSRTRASKEEKEEEEEQQRTSEPEWLVQVPPVPCCRPLFWLQTTEESVRACWLSIYRTRQLS